MIVEDWWLQKRENHISGKLGYRVVVYGEGNDFRVQRIKLSCLLIEIIIGKYIWLTLSRSKISYSPWSTKASWSLRRLRPFLPHFAIMREQLLSNLVSAIIKIGWMYTKIIKSTKISRWPIWNAHHKFAITVRTGSQVSFEHTVRLYTVIL